jgi:hypothetical protein
MRVYLVHSISSVKATYVSLSLCGLHIANHLHHKQNETTPPTRTTFTLHVVSRAAAGRPVRCMACRCLGGLGKLKSSVPRYWQS